MPSLKSYIKKAATNAVKKRAAKGAAGAMAGVFGTGLIGKALSAQMDGVGDFSGDGDTGEQQGTSQKSIALQQNMAGTLVRIETIAQHISDNLYNIAGVMNAQLTSMEETRRDMATQSSREAATKEEKMTEGILGGKMGEAAEGGSGSLAKKLLVGQAIKAAVTNPYVLGTLALLASAIGLKLAWNRRDPDQAPTINDQAKKNGITPGAQGALNARNALKKSTQFGGPAIDENSFDYSNEGRNKIASAALPESTADPAGAWRGQRTPGAPPPFEAGGGRSAINPQDATAVPTDAPMAASAVAAPVISQGGSGRGNINPPMPSAAPSAVAPSPQQSQPAAQATSKPTAAETATSGYASLAYDLITKEEGLPKNNKAYVDQTGVSIGYGHQIKSNEYAQGFIQAGDEVVPIIGDRGLDTIMTPTQAKKLLRVDLPKYEQAAKKPLGAAWNKLNDTQKAALTSYAYNTGSTDKLVKYGLKEKIEMGDIQGAAQIITTKGTNTGKGIVLPTLVKRRAHEGALFAGTPSGTMVASTPASGSTIGAQSVQVASAAKAGGGTTNINTVNNNGGGQQMASARREIPSPIAGRGSLEQSTVFAASA
jgi:GH24 family phage-related lysozyme (muramidase)